MLDFAHLHVHSAFSFLDGGSSVEALVLRAARLGQSALALTDTMSVTGGVALSRRCHKAGIQPIGGCEVILEGGHRQTLLADGPTGWSSLCQILTAAYLRDPERKGARRVRWEDLEATPAPAWSVCPATPSTVTSLACCDTGATAKPHASPAGIWPCSDRAATPSR